MEGSLEGRAGAYWGVFNANRQPKFAFTGPVIEDPNWPWKAAIASLHRAAADVLVRAPFHPLHALGLVFFCVLIQVSASMLVWSATLPYEFYLDPLDWAMLVLLFPAQLAIMLILLINGFEFTEVLWRPRWLREFRLLPPDPSEQQPFVSIHLACYNEPPEMVILTLDSLAALDYAELRSARDRQQHQERGSLEAGRGALRETRRAIPLLPSRSVAGLQGRRAELRARRKPIRAPRSSPSSMPTTRCAPTG